MVELRCAGLIERGRDEAVSWRAPAARGCWIAHESYYERVLLDVMGHQGSPTVRGCAMEGEKTLILFLGGPPLRGAAGLSSREAADVTNFWDTLVRYYLEPSAR